MIYIFRKDLNSLYKNKKIIIAFFILIMIVPIFFKYIGNLGTTEEAILSTTGMIFNSDSPFITNCLFLLNILFFLYFSYIFLLNDFKNGSCNIFLRMSSLKWITFKLISIFSFTIIFKIIINFIVFIEFFLLEFYYLNLNLITTDIIYTNAFIVTVHFMYALFYYNKVTFSLFFVLLMVILIKNFYIIGLMNFYTNKIFLILLPILLIISLLYLTLFRKIFNTFFERSFY